LYVGIFKKTVRVVNIDSEYPFWCKCELMFISL